MTRSTVRHLLCAFIGRPYARMPYRACWTAGLLLLLAGCGHPDDLPTAERGEMDLRAFDFTHTVPLRGEWLAQAQVDSAHFATYAYDDRHWRAVEVEGGFQEQGFPPQGFVWYRLHLRLPPGAPPLEGYLRQADNAHALYVARPGRAPHLVAASGRPALTEHGTVLSRKPVLFTLPADTALVLSWQVASYAYRDGGPFNAIGLGPQPTLTRRWLWSLAAAFASFGLYVLIAFSFLLYWGQNRTAVRSLAIGLLAMAMAVRTVAISGALEYLMPRAFTFEIRILLEATSYLGLNGLLALLLWSFFPEAFTTLTLGSFTLRPYDIALEEPEPDTPPAGAPRLPSWLRRLNTLAVLLGLATSAACVLISTMSGTLLTSHLLALSRWISLLLVVPAVIVVTDAARASRPLGVSMAFGLLLLFGGGIHDVLFAMGLFKGHLYLATYTFLGFVLVQGYALARRYANHAALARRSASDLQHVVDTRTKALRAASLAAQAANIAKSQFLTSVTHELRTPLTSILGFSDLLREELDAHLNAQQREFFHIIHFSGERLLRLVNDLLDIGRSESGHLTLTITAVPLSSLLKDVCDQLYPIVKEKGLGLGVSSEVPAPEVRADAARLRQVLLNLLSNAVKFTECGQVRLRVYEAKLGGQPAFAIAVEDTGLGISPDFMPHLFERFTQETRVYEKAQQGTGLGLAISHKLVTEMGGEITVESTVGVGSTFTVILPSAVAPSRGAPARPSPVAWRG